MPLAHYLALDIVNGIVVVRLELEDLGAVVLDSPVQDAEVCHNRSKS